MKVQETHDIIIKDYPYADSIMVDHFPLTREVYNADGGLTNVRALQTEVYYDVVDSNIKNLLIGQWDFFHRQIYQNMRLIITGLQSIIEETLR